MLVGDKEYSEALLCLQTGLPGVLFVLPDSYVDPENKDYGGNCYSASAIDIANFSVSVRLTWNMKAMCWLVHLGKANESFGYD